MPCNKIPEESGFMPCSVMKFGTDTLEKKGKKGGRRCIEGSTYQ